jgi:hypothetical protein
MDTRILSLIKLLEQHYHHNTETFTDEDTGEEVTIERKELINPYATEEERELMEDIIADVANLSDEDLMAFRDNTIGLRPLDFDELYLELIRRGDESWAANIESPTILQELCDKGNKWAAYALYNKYRWGDEKQGIFINRQKAKEYYDLAGDIPYKNEWDDTDEAGEEYPTTYEYTLTGDAATLDGVETLIRDLCKRCGIPENEEDGLGLYVPQRTLMKVLVGSDTVYYRGNILYMNRNAPDCLSITTESEQGEPLLYAFRQCFENLNVEFKRID